jgi:hypothetical protein
MFSETAVWYCNVQLMSQNFNGGLKKNTAVISSKLRDYYYYYYYDYSNTVPDPVAARLLRSWFRIPPGAWMSVCCECCMLSGRGLCDELITRLEKSYRL